jgi:hypothetical protein
MICENCKTRNVDGIETTYRNYNSTLFIYCRICREALIPEHIDYRQYVKYWLEFSKKHRK